MEHPRLARKITATLFTAQSLGSAGFIATATVSSIVGSTLSGSPALAGLPSAVYLLGSALAALGLGFLMDRAGRRGGISAGLLLGVLGAGIAVQSIATHSFPFFLVGMGLMGVAQSALQLGRFAAAEVHPPLERGRAISNVVIGGAVGAILGPLFVGPSGRLAQSFGLDELAGPFGIALILLALSCSVVFLFLRPDPRDIGRRVAQLYPPAVSIEGPARSLFEIFRQPAPFVALISMIFGQLIMVMLMVITSLHLKEHQHMLSDISLVISSHTFGMFAFSVLSGRLADRFGREPVIFVGVVTLILACLSAPLSPEVLPLAIALFLLGLGWNFCYVGGSSLLADHLLPAEKARAQGFNDLLIGMVSALGSLSSGFLFAGLGYGLMGVLGAVFALIPLTMVIWRMMSRRRLAIAE